jgi:GAF domain-containing protein
VKKRRITVKRKTKTIANGTIDFPRPPIWTPEEEEVPNDLAKQIASAAYLAQIDADVQATITQELASDDGLRSEMYTFIHSI